MSLTVEPATLNDVPALAKIFFSGFNDELFRSLFPPTPPGQEYIEEGYASWITGKEGMQKAKVFVVRGENGIPISSMLLWFVTPEDKILKPWTERWPVPKETMSHEMIEGMFTVTGEQHYKAMGEKEHIYLELIVTQQESQKRGYGTTLLKHANQVADEMDYPLYLDAEKDAKGLYVKVGYEEVPGVAQGSPLAPLLRKRKSEREI